MKKIIITFSFLLITSIPTSQTAPEYFETANSRFNIESYYAAIEYGYDDKNHVIKKKCKKYWRKE